MRSKMTLRERRSRAHFTPNVARKQSLVAATYQTHGGSGSGLYFVVQQIEQPRGTVRNKVRTQVKTPSTRLR